MIGLNALFARCLLIAGILVVLLGAAWWFTIVALVRTGFVLPASSAESAAVSAVQRLQDGGTEALAEISPLVRWARFDASGALLEQSGMDGRLLNAAQRALEGKTFTAMIPYAQYHRVVRLIDGSTVVLQYDFAMQYANVRMRGRWPDFQIVALAALLISWAMVFILTARGFAHILRMDTDALMQAVRAIADRRLDIEPGHGARVRELSAALGTLDELRSSLSQSLQTQWAMQQRRNEEIAALAHDIRTPLTAILGNAELLAEDETQDDRRLGEEAIVREAERIRSYIDALSKLAKEHDDEQQVMEAVHLGELFDEWRAAGEALCRPKEIRFEAICADALHNRMLYAQREALLRAVINLLDNAVRFAPQGGSVRLSVTESKGVIRISVEDSGSGFTAQALKMAGYALYTGDRARAADGHSGMGLCFVRQVALRHGGELLLENTGSGAKASIVLEQREK